uniref:Transcription initiation factor TFIID subunit 8 n=1 Tax=Steinernema glaseri TaxID=37863 RepID=A0A1I7Y5Y3_9BILA
MLSSFSSNISVDKYAPTSDEYKFRQVIRQGTGAICKNSGFTHIDPNALELLSEMMLSHILDACAATKLITENAGRTVATPTDAILGLIDSGTDVSALADYFARLRLTGSLVVFPPKKANPSTQMKALKVGEARPHPPHIPAWMPPFPDPHTYIKTTVSGDPDSDYSKLRELNSVNQRNVDNALKDFMLRVHPSLTLFRKYELEIRQLAETTIKEQNEQREARILLQQQLRERRPQKPKPKPLGREVPCDFLDDQMDHDGARAQSSREAALRMEEREAQKEEEEAEEEEDEQDEDNVEMNIDDDVEELAAEITKDELFSLPQTEISILRSHIPTSCQILIPKDEDFPYVTALLAADLQDEDDTKPSTPINGEPTGMLK